MPDTAAPVETVTATSPPPTTEPKIVSNEWDVEDYDFDPELDGSPVKAPAQKPAASTPPKPETPPPAPAPKHSDRVLRLAKHFNISQQEIDSSSTDQLLREVQAAQLEHATAMAQQSQNRVPESAGQRQQTPAPDSQTEPEWTIGEWTDPEGKKSKFEEMVDPVFASYLKQQHETIRQLQKQVEGLTQAHRHQTAMTTAERFDKKFAGNESRYGKGTVRDIQRGTPEAIRRTTLVGIVHQLAQADPSIPIETLFDRADAILYGESAPVPTTEPTPSRQPPPQNPLNGRFVSPAEWDGAALAKPTHRSPQDEPLGDRRALRNLNKKLVEKGIDPNAITVDDPELPD